MGKIIKWNKNSYNVLFNYSVSLSRFISFDSSLVKEKSKSNEGKSWNCKIYKLFHYH